MSEFNALFDEFEKTQPLSDRPDDFEPTFSKFEELKDQQLRTSLHNGVQKNPDSFAKVVKLARENNLPPETVETQLPEVERRERFNAIDIEGVKKDSPVLAQFLSERMNSGVAYDDIDNLSLLEKAFYAPTDIARGLPAGAIDFFGRAFSGAGRGYQAIHRNLSKGLDAILPESFDDLIWWPEDTPEWMRKTDPGYWLRYEGEGLKAAAKVIGAPEERQNLATDIAAGVGQVAGQLSLLFVMPTTGSGALFTQGVDIQGEKQAELGVEGTPRGDAALAAGGMVTLIAERTGLDLLMNRVPPQIKNTALRHLTDVALAGGIEALEEVIEGITHNLVEYAFYNPEAEFFEGIEHEAVVAGGTGATVRSILLALTPGKGRSKSEQDRLDQMIEATNKSQLKTRDTETFKAHVKSIAERYGESENVFIPADEIVRYFQEETPDENLPIIDDIAEQMTEAVQTGGDIVLPIEDYLAHLSEVESLRPHIRLTPDSLSQAEAEALKNTDQAQSIIEEAKQFAEEKAQADQVLAQVSEQLFETGRLGETQSRVTAEVISSYVAVQAAREGVPVEDVFAQMGLNIVGPETDPAATTLNQSIPLEQNFGDLTLSEEVEVEGTGKTVTVTQPAQKAFDRVAKRRNVIQKLRDCLDA